MSFKCPRKLAESLQRRNSLKAVRDLVSLHISPQEMQSRDLCTPDSSIHPSNHPLNRYVPKAYNVQGTIYLPTWASGGDAEYQWGAGEGQEVRE